MRITNAPPEVAMTELVWAYLVVRYWRSIAWTFAWMFAFWAPVLIPIPLVGWCAPPLLYWAAVSSRRRRLDRQEEHRCVMPDATRKKLSAMTAGSAGT